MWCYRGSGTTDGTFDINFTGIKETKLVHILFLIIVKFSLWISGQNYYNVPNMHSGKAL